MRRVVSVLLFIAAALVVVLFTAGAVVVLEGCAKAPTVTQVKQGGEIALTAADVACIAAVTFDPGAPVDAACEALIQNEPSLVKLLAARREKVEAMAARPCGAVAK